MSSTPVTSVALVVLFAVAFVSIGALYSRVVELKRASDVGVAYAASFDILNTVLDCIEYSSYTGSPCVVVMHYSTPVRIAETGDSIVVSHGPASVHLNRGVLLRDIVSKVGYVVGTPGKTMSIADISIEVGKCNSINNLKINLTEQASSDVGVAVNVRVGDKEPQEAYIYVCVGGIG